MGKLAGLAAAAGALASAGAAHAATLEIQNAAVRVVVIPEARADVSVTVVHANPRLPLKVSTGPLGEVIVDGGLGYGWFWQRPVTCGPAGPGGWMDVWGVGPVAYEDLPQVVARVPLDAQVRSTAAVFGAISAANNLDLDNASCGEWVVDNVRDRLSVRNSGSGRVRAGEAGEMALAASGSGSILTRAAVRGLDARVSGSGGVRVEQASGPVQARVSGSGDIEMAARRRNWRRARPDRAASSSTASPKMCRAIFQGRAKCRWARSPRASASASAAAAALPWASSPASSARASAAPARSASPKATPATWTQRSPAPAASPSTAWPMRCGPAPPAPEASASGACWGHWTRAPRARAGSLSLAADCARVD